MSRMGYIYKITNDFDNMVYIGQTSRDIYTRFNEHISEKRGYSKLHNAIQKNGYRHFKIEEIECIPIEKLDEREKYWIKYYDSQKNGYNILAGGIIASGKYYDNLLIVEKNIIVDSLEYLARLIDKNTSWGLSFIKEKIREIKDTEKDFLGYHFKSIKTDKENFTDENVVEEWIKTLNITHQGKYVYCKELDMEFETVAAAAQYLINNNLIESNSKYLIQSVITSISNNIRHKTEFIKSTKGRLTFETIPGKTTKINGGNFENTPIYCQELDMEFSSQTDAAHYFIDNKIWTGIKLKTAKLRISDVVRGAFPDYKGYTFVKRRRKNEK